MSNLLFNTKLCLAVALPMLSVMFSLQSCSTYSDEPVAADEQSQTAYNIRFTIGSDSITSRSETVYTPGEDMENYIRDVRMYIFVDDKYFEDITVMSYAQTTYDPERYVVSGKIAKLPTKDFKVMVLANMDSTGGVSNYYPTMNSGTTYLGVVQWNCYYSYHDEAKDRDRQYTPYKPSTDQPMPMYGTKQYVLNDLYFDPTIATDMGEVDLLRAMAKVRINCEQGGISNVVLTRCKVGGMGCPLAMYSNTTYPENSNMNVPNTVNYYRNTADVYDLPFDEVTDGKSYQIYVPEYNNLSDASARTEIEFTYKGMDYKVEFKDYDTGEYFNILRNHYYQFDVSFNEYPTVIVKYSASGWRHSETSEIIFD